MFGPDRISCHVTRRSSCPTFAGICFPVQTALLVFYLMCFATVAATVAATDYVAATGLTFLGTFLLSTVHEKLAHEPTRIRHDKVGRLRRDVASKVDAWVALPRRLAVGARAVLLHLEDRDAPSLVFVSAARGRGLEQRDVLVIPRA